MIKWFKKYLLTQKNMKEGRFFWTKRVLATVLFSVIALTFVFFGYEQTSRTEMGTAAEVNDTIISIAQFRHEAQNLERYYSRIFGEQMEFFRKTLPKQALDQLIQLELAYQQGSKEGVWGTDEEVKDFLVNEVPILQESGRFKKDFYFKFLEQQQLDAGEFEGQIKKQNLSRRIQHFFELSLKPSTLELEKEFLLRETKLNIDFLVFSEDQLSSENLITPHDTNSFLSSEEGKKSTEKYFSEHPSEFTQDEQVHARHILVKFKENDSQSESEALKKIEEIAKKINGTNFSNLAKQYSEDEGTKEKGGDLGFFSRGRMVPPFEAVAFNQAVGLISSPTKSSFGYHLIEVLEKKEKKTFVFDEVKNKIALNLIHQKKLEESKNKINELLKNGNLNEIKEMAKKWKVKWEETGLFGLKQESIPKIGSIDEAAEMLLELNKENPLASKIISQNEKHYILLLKDMKTIPFEKSKGESISSEMAQSAGGEVFRQWMDHLTKNAKVVKNMRIIGNEL